MGTIPGVFTRKRAGVWAVVALIGLAIVAPAQAQPALRAALTGHQKTVDALAFSPDGRLLASAGWDGAVRLWNAKTGQPVHTLTVPWSRAMCLAFSPNGALLASGNYDHTITLWEVKTRRLVRTLRGHQGYVPGIGFSPDGARLVSGSYDKTAKVWELKTGRTLATLRGHTWWVNPATFSPDGKFIATGDRKVVWLWDARTYRLRRTLPGLTHHIVFTRDGSLMAAGNAYAFKIPFWDARTWRSAGGIEMRRGTREGIAFSPDGRTLAVAVGPRERDRTRPGEVVLYDVRTGAERWSAPIPGGPVNAVAFSPDGRTLASSGRDRVIRLWSMPAGWSRPSPARRSP